MNSFSTAVLLSFIIKYHLFNLIPSHPSLYQNKRFLIHPPVMMHRDGDHTAKREMDIESLVDSVIDEHMSNNNNNNIASNCE